MTTVGILGLGNMGSAMARRLADEEFPLVVFNRTSERAAIVADETGAAVAATPAELAAKTDVVLSCLSDEAAVRAVFEAADGVLAGLSPGAVVVEMSTVPPHVPIALGRAVRAAGSAFLDAPVSGSVPSLLAGELTVMAGGEAADLERVEPVLSALARRVFHMGPLGTGAAMKLVVNSVVFALNQALSEALVLAERAGVDRLAAYDVLASSAVAAPLVHYKRAAFEKPGETPVAFRLVLAEKDLGLIHDLAIAVGAPMPQSVVNRQVLAEALLAGLADADFSMVAELLRRQSEG